MKIKKSMFVLLATGLLAVTSCGNTNNSSSTKVTSLPSGDGETINMSVMYQKSGTRMKYATDDEDNKVFKDFTKSGGTDDSNGYTHGDVTYKKGEWKPVWKAVQSKLNFTIKDNTPTSETTIAKAFSQLQTNGFSDVNIAQGSATSIVDEGTTKGTILDLNEYLDLMPNFKAFLEKNPAIKNMIQDSYGHMYYAPYFDGLDDIERTLMVRVDWVQKLLDGDDTTVPTDTKTINNKSYTAFYGETETKQVTVVKADGSGSTTITKNKTENIITKQNNLSSMTGANLVRALRSYIDNTYSGVYGSKRSDLFCGQNAAYDVDELIALFRCVKACSNTLTGTDKEIYPLFPRDESNDRTADLWRFTQFFGVRGGESRSGYLYVDSNGNIKDARGQKDMAQAITKLNEMYKEGLILKNFDSRSSAGLDAAEFRKQLLKGDKLYGFATYDYVQTTVVYNDDSSINAQNDGKFLFAPIMPATAKWNGSDDYSFFTESWRSVKTEGWFITADTAKDLKKLSKCLQLFDYFYSDEGNRLMSYGPDEYLAKDSDGNIKYIDYQGKKVPQLSDETLNEISVKASGNYTNYYRYWIGATYPVGYVKEQGMEYQTVSTHKNADGVSARDYLDRINTAISTGVLKHVNFSTSNSDKFYNIVPTTFSFTKAQQNAVSSDYTDLDSYLNNTKGKTNAWTKIVQNGWGGDNPADIDAYLTKVNTDLKCDNLVKIYQAAYSKMVSNSTGAVITGKEDF
jgi:hypothetical protein